jgi:hypothetical protein
MLRPPGEWRDAYYVLPTVHASLGTLVEFLVKSLL